MKENFQNDYQGSLQRLETSVQDEYILNLRQACYRERNYSTYNHNLLCSYNMNIRYSIYIYIVMVLIFFVEDALLWKARSFQDQEMFYKARNIETPSCQKLQDLQVT